MSLELQSQTQPKTHYIECHLVVSEDRKGRSLMHAKSAGWWGSRLKEDGSNEEWPGDLILTTRKPTQEAAVEAIRSLARTLRDNGFTVTRGKTEVVSFDTKRGDSFEG
ncbi:MAG: hypothetical protein AB7L09_03260 [Nitrospira sp.]